MPGPLGKLTAVLGIDAREFQTGIQGAQKDLAGFGVNSKTAFTALGAGATAGFAALTTGALQAEAAQGKFMAATGASREEAKAFVSDMDGLAGSAGAVGMSFEDIAKTGTMVEQQFGVSGKAAQDLTGNILEFSKVTGQDATGAAADLEDTLSAFGMTADDATGFMDELVASNQKFGTDAGPEALSVLRNMSPALQAVGGDLDDGVGFLNLFETAGLDASAAATGLNKSIKTLKPGQTLDDLIAQIGAIEDPMLRAQKAAELFGSKAGPKLAAAIKPGMTSLDDFKVSAEEAAGASGQAAEDMLTMSDKIRGVFDKLGAGARELGQTFGPAVTGLGTAASGLATVFTKLNLGPAFGSLVGKLKDGFMGLAAKVIPTATISGTAIGAAEGEAAAVGATSTGIVQKFLQKFGLMTGAKVVAATAAGTAEGVAEGEAAAAAASGPGMLSKWGGAGKLLGGAVKAGILLGIGTILVDVAVQQASDAKEAIANDPNKITPDDLFDMRAPMWAKAKLTAAQEMQNMGQASLAAFNTAWQAGIDKGMLASDPALLAAAKAAGEAAGKQVGTSAASSAGQAIGTLLPEQINHNISEHADEAAAATAVLAAKQAAAYEDTVNRNKASLSLWGLVRDKQVADAAKAKELFANSAQAISSSIVQALKGTPDKVSSIMDDLKYAINHPLALVKQNAEIEALLISKKLQQGLASKNPLIRTQAEQTKDALIRQWESLNGKVYHAANETSKSLADGLNNDYAKAVADAKRAAQQINAWLDSIKNHIRVVIDVDRTGQGPVAHGHRALGGPVSANTMYEVAEGGIPEMLRMGGKSFLLMGAVGGYVERINKAMSGFSAAPVPVATRGGGGGDVHIHINGNQYGGRAGLRDLAREIENAVRQGTRGAGWQVGR